MLAATLSLGLTGVASADNPNWTPEKNQKVADSRRSNAGTGNGSEDLPTAAKKAPAKKAAVKKAPAKKAAVKKAPAKKAPAKKAAHPRR